MLLREVKFEFIHRVFRSIKEWYRKYCISYTYPFRYSIHYICVKLAPSAGGSNRTFPRSTPRRMESFSDWLNSESYHLNQKGNMYRVNDHASTLGKKAVRFTEPRVPATIPNNYVEQPGTCTELPHPTDFGERPTLESNHFHLSSPRSVYANHADPDGCFGDTVIANNTSALFSTFHTNDTENNVGSLVWKTYHQLQLECINSLTF